MVAKRGCPICGAETHQLATYCKRCKKLMDRNIREKPNRDARVPALTNAWDGECFRCYYTGAKLVEDDHHNPRYITYDHRTPRQEDDVVVCAACMNDMKSDLSEAEFRAVVIQLASHFSGGPFDEAVLNLKHWNR